MNSLSKTKPMVQALPVSSWVDDLIWCPSQCYYLFTIHGKEYTIYLRWRSFDPWTVSLVEGNLMNDHDGNWLFDIDAPYGRESELQDVKDFAIQKVIEFFNDDYLPI